MINKEEIIPYITKAVQEEDEKVRRLEGKVNEQEIRITKLEGENEMLKMTMEELVKRVEKLESKEEANG